MECEINENENEKSHFFNFANTPTKGIKWGSGSYMYRLQESQRFG